MGDHVAVDVVGLVESRAESTEEEAATLIGMVECRICQEEDLAKNLESPCACSGSLKMPGVAPLSFHVLPPTVWMPHKNAWIEERKNDLLLALFTKPKGKPTLLTLGAYQGRETGCFHTLRVEAFRSLYMRFDQGAPVSDALVRAMVAPRVSSWGSGFDLEP